MLFLRPGTSDPVRAQGTFVSDDEVHRIVKYLRDISEPSYHPELVQLNRIDAGDMEKDEFFDEAVQIVLETRRGSVSLLQRRLNVGYSRASRLIDQMAAAGIVGDYKGSQAREVMITPDEYQAIKAQMDRDGASGFKDMQEDKEITPEVTGAGSAAGAIDPQQTSRPTTSTPPSTDDVPEDEEDDEPEDDENDQQQDDEYEEADEEEEEEEEEEQQQQDSQDDLEDEDDYEYDEDESTEEDDKLAL